MNPYEILDIPRDADAEVIKKAFRAKAKELPPDRNEGKTEEAFKKVKEAYDILSDGRKRSLYDDGLDTDSISNISREAQNYILDIFMSLTQIEISLETNTESRFTVPIGICTKISSYENDIAHLENSKKQINKILTFLAGVKPRYVHKDPKNADLYRKATLQTLETFTNELNQVKESIAIKKEVIRALKEYEDTGRHYDSEPKERIAESSFRALQNPFNDSMFST